MHTIAEQYFEFRARLGTSLFALSRLAQEAGLPEARLPLIQDLITSLKEPFVFVVVGEVNTGKSTFLNALFGEEFSQVGVIPTTDRICVFCHGEETKELLVHETLVEMHSPHEFLKDFNIVDTPGTNSIEDEHQQITERFVPMADLVIFMFSVTNPWGASTWEFLERVHKNWMKNVIFVLGQSDLRAPEEVAEVISHMKRTSQERLGRIFPIYPVSSKQAYLAKTSGIDSERLYGNSGFGPLEDYIGDIVSGASRRVEKLRNIVRTSRVLLGEIRERVVGVESLLERDRALLGELDRTVYEQRERTRSKFASAVRGLDNRYQELSAEGGEFLEGQLSLSGSFRRLFAKEQLADKLERRMVHRMVEESRSTLTGVAGIIEDDLRHLWKRLGGGLQDHLTEIGSEASMPEPDWTVQRSSFMERLESTVKTFVGDLKVRDDYHLRLLTRRRLMIVWLLLMVACVGGSITLFFLGFQPAHLYLLLAGAGIGLLGFAYLKWTIVRLKADFAKRVEASREPMGQRLAQTMDVQVNEYYQEFIKLFSPLRRSSEGRRDSYEPTVQQYHALNNSFDQFAKQLVMVEREAEE